MNLGARVRIDEETGCWVWQGPRGGENSQYGRVELDGRSHQAHRVAFSLFLGAVPEDRKVRRRCGNRLCVCPRHLYVSSQREVVLSGGGAAARNALKTHCVRGHRFNDENTRVSADGARQCRVCDRERAARRKAQRRAEASA